MLLHGNFCSSLGVALMMSAEAGGAADAALSQPYETATLQYQLIA